MKVSIKLILILLSFQCLTIVTSQLVSCPSYPFQAQSVSTSTINFPICPYWRFLYFGEGTFEIKASGDDILVSFFGLSNTFRTAFKINSNSLNLYKNGDLKNIKSTYEINLNPALINTIKFNYEKHNQTWVIYIGGLKIAEFKDDLDSDIINISLAQLGSGNVVYYQPQVYLENLPIYPLSPKNQAECCGLWENINSEWKTNTTVVNFYAKGNGLIIGFYDDNGINNGPKNFIYALKFLDKEIKLYINGDLNKAVNSGFSNAKYDRFNQYKIEFNKSQLSIIIYINGVKIQFFKVDNWALNGNNIYYTFSQSGSSVVIDEFPKCISNYPLIPRRGPSYLLDFECFKKDWKLVNGEISFNVTGTDFSVALFNSDRYASRNFNYNIRFVNNQNVKVFKDQKIISYDFLGELIVGNGNTHTYKIKIDSKNNAINLFLDGVLKVTYTDSLGLSFKDGEIYYSLSQKSGGNTVFNNVLVASS